MGPFVLHRLPTALCPLLLSAGLILARPAAVHAEPCMRPDSPAGYQGFAYGDTIVHRVEGARVRVSYVEEGSHRVGEPGDSGGPAPIAVLAAAVGDEALDAFGSWGFRAPLAARSSRCGHGDLVDLYLVHFTGGDGLTATEQCVSHGGATTCESFALIDSRLDQRYPTVEEGIRTVVPHELFHAVQNAYEADHARFWAEGTAQWAAARLTPGLPDLIKNLDAFLNEPGRALDGPVTGVTAAYLYGSALWPIFLSQRFGDHIVEHALEAQAGGATALDGVGEVLAARGSSLADTYVDFVLANFATGTRTPKTPTPSAYLDAASYPEAAVEPWQPGADGASSGVLSGLSSRAYAYAEVEPRLVSLGPSSPSIRGYFLPLHDGHADLSGAVELTEPRLAKGLGLLVAVNTATSKVDAPYRFAVTAAPEVEGPPTTSSPSSSSSSASSSSAGEGGCSFGPPPRRASSLSLALLPLAAAALRLRRPRARQRINS